MNDLYGSAWLFWFGGVEQWEGIAIFTQANSSPIGESSKTSPKSFARILAQASELDFKRKTILLRRDGLA